MRLKETPTHAVWQAMKQRCKNPNDKGFANYGGRGITYDPAWETFEGFITDMGYRPEITEGELSLERLNNDLDYTKANCIWATRTAQNHNQRLRLDNKLGIKGIGFKRGCWEVAGQTQGRRTTLYWGFDFFEACCARKSWEVKVAGESTARRGPQVL